MYRFYKSDLYSSVQLNQSKKSSLICAFNSRRCEVYFADSPFFSNLDLSRFLFAAICFFTRLLISAGEQLVVESFDIWDIEATSKMRHSKFEFQNAYLFFVKINILKMFLFCILEK